MKKLLSLLILLLIGLGAQAQSRRLGTISFTGLDTQSSGLKDQIRDILGGELNSENLKTCIQTIFDTHRYTGIEVYTEERGDRVDVIFRLAPQRVITNIVFAGMKSFNKSELLNELGLGEGELFSQSKVKDGVERLKRFYNLSGFLNASVSADFKVSASGRDVTMILNIDEQAPCKITAVNFRSPNESLNTDLSQKIKRHLNKNFSQARLDLIQNELQDRLIEKRFFSSTLGAPELKFDDLKTTAVLDYVVPEPFAFGLVFEGNKQFTESQLLKELQLDKEHKLGSSPVDDINERLLSFYKGSGYANVAIKHTESLFLSENVRRIVFKIEEGPRIRIRAFSIEGVFSRKTGYYADFLKENSGELTTKNVYNAVEIDNGISNLIADLQNQGFINAKVISTRADFNDRRDAVTLRVNLEEGPQTFIRKISFNGIKVLSVAQLESVVGMQSGQPLNLKTVSEAVAHIIDAYKNAGHLEVKVANEGQAIISYNAENTKADLNFEIVEGPLITVGSVLIEGNSFTKDYVIRRELQFSEGEVLTPEKISYTEERLQRLSLFTGIDIRTLDQDSEQGKRTVLVQVAEHDPGLFKSGVGVNNELDLSLKTFAGAAYRNLWGTGRSINARVELNYKPKYKFIENDINFGYSEPYIFGTKNTARLSGVRSTQLYSINQKLNQAFAIENTQADLALIRDLGRYLKLVYSLYGIARTNTFEIENKVASQPLLIATTGPTVLYDFRDNLFNPHKGELASWNLELSHPTMGSTSTVGYYRSTAGYTRYIPMGRLVLATEGKAGYLKNISPADDGAVPEIKAFILGSRSTIRGFSPTAESIPSRSDFANSQISIPTESYFLLAKSEVRFPIYGNFAGAVFYDGGRVGIPNYYTRFWWRDSVGLGFRIITPVGPVSFEYGLKLNRDEARNESPGEFHFSIGVF